MCLSFTKFSLHSHWSLVYFCYVLSFLDYFLLCCYIFQWCMSRICLQFLPSMLVLPFMHLSLCASLLSQTTSRGDAHHQPCIQTFIRRATQSWMVYGRKVSVTTSKTCLRKKLYVYKNPFFFFLFYWNYSKMKLKYVIQNFSLCK